MNARMAGRDDERAAAHGKFQARLAEHLEAGQHLPCMGTYRDNWTSEDPEDQAIAARACIACPALDACTRYITKNPEPAGVWAGRTPAQRNTRMKENPR